MNNLMSKMVKVGALAVASYVSYKVVETMSNKAKERNIEKMVNDAVDKAMNEQNTTETIEEKVERLEADIEKMQNKNRKNDNFNLIMVCLIAAELYLLSRKIDRTMCVAISNSLNVCGILHDMGEIDKDTLLQLCDTASKYAPHKLVRDAAKSQIENLLAEVK